jgi:hypothetical protein
MSTQLIVEPQGFTRTEWRKRWGQSLTFYHKERRAGRGPDEIWFGSKAIITLKAEREWLARKERDASSKAAELERARRRKAMSLLGKRAAQSPLHISKRKLRNKNVET